MSRWQTDGRWEVVHENAPRHPVRCEFCGAYKRWHSTFRLAFKGLTHEVGADRREHARHGPGYWVCPACAVAVEDTEPIVTEDRLLIVEGDGWRKVAALEMPEPVQGSLL